MGKKAKETVSREHKKAMRVVREAMKLLAELKKIDSKAPRAGVKPTKVFKNKKKYSRKKKHKNKD